MDSLQQRKEGRLKSLLFVDLYAVGGVGGRGEKLYQTIFYVLDWFYFVFYVWERDLLSEYLQYWPHDM